MHFISFDLEKLQGLVYKNLPVDCAVRKSFNENNRSNNNNNNNNNNNGRRHMDDDNNDESNDSRQPKKFKSDPSTQGDLSYHIRSYHIMTRNII